VTASTSQKSKGTSHAYGSKVYQGYVARKQFTCSRRIPLGVHNIGLSGDSNSVQPTTLFANVAIIYKSDVWWIGG